MPAYKDKNGKWFAKFKYKDWQGNNKYVTKRGFATKREAANYEIDFKKRISGDTGMTFAGFVEVYKEEVYPRLRTSTRANKDEIIDSKITPYFSKVKLSDIDHKMIIKWQNILLDSINPKTGQKYSPTYIKSVHNQLNAILNYAVKHYNLKENPVLRAGSIGSKYAKEMNIWTMNEYLVFSEALMDKPMAYYCFEILYWCGLRVGELLALTASDLDLDECTISVTKTYQVINGKEVVGPPKTSKGYRTVVMPKRVAEEMKDYMEMLYDKNDSRLFPITKSYITHVMGKYSQIAGVQKIRIHDLRHSHVSLLINMGFSAVDIAKRVGHESITITLHYAHMFPSAQSEMANMLDSLVKEDDDDC